MGLAEMVHKLLNPRGRDEAHERRLRRADAAVREARAAAEEANQRIIEEYQRTERLMRMALR